jgi:hypothetical protein
MPSLLVVLRFVESTFSFGTTTVYFPFPFVSFVSSIDIAPQHPFINLLTLKGFRLLPQYWGREKGVLFYAGVSPSKLGPIAPY